MVKTMPGQDEARGNLVESVAVLTFKSIVDRVQRRKRLIEPSSSGPEVFPQDSWRPLNSVSS
ncbi:hypothetical protein JTE90_009853, partial [Oedothorax gibbosus]